MMKNLLRYATVAAVVVSLVGFAKFCLAAEEAPPKKIVLIAGKKSHGPSTHEYEKGARLFKECLDKSPNVKGLKTVVVTNGWPENEKLLDDAATIVLFSDGSDHNEKDHPLLNDERMEVVARQMKRGCGYVALHYTTFTPREKSPQFLEWLGGFYDYESGPPPKNWWSKHEVGDYSLKLPTPDHAIATGVQSFKLHEEVYYQMRFRTPDERRKNLLNFGDDVELGTIAWAIERADGGRGFGYTGGHFHKNWGEENIRRLVLNAIVWTAKADVPTGGVQSSLPADWEK